MAEMALALLGKSELAVAIYDDADVLRFANEIFVDMFHQRPDDRSTWSDAMRANYAYRRGLVVNNSMDFEAWLASAASRRGKQAFRGFEADLYDGRWIWMTETTLDSGWLLSVAADITNFYQDARALRQVRDHALHLAQTDDLTGISNRTFMMRRLGQLMAMQGPLVVAVLDLDRFKQINDLYGHLGGDEVIRDFARHLQASIRRADSCGRVGGEEFMLLLPDCDLEQAQAIVGLLLERVRAASPLAEAPAQRYTVSAGLALHQPGEGLVQLYQRADDALYQAKREGRDRLMCAPPPA